MARSQVVTVMLAVAASACITACHRNDPANNTEQSPPPVIVSSAPVTATDARVTIDATGSFAAAESSDVAPEVSGKVIETPVDVGMFVKKGDVLVRLRGVDATLKLDEAQAAVTRAEANVKLAESQNTLAQTTAAALLQSAGHRRRVAHGRRSGPHAGRNPAADRGLTRAPRWQKRRRSWRSRRRRSAMSSSPPRSPDSSAPGRSPSASYVQPSNRVVTLVEIDPSEAAADDSPEFRRHASRSARAGQRHRRCVPRADVHRDHHRRVAIVRSAVPLLHRRGPRPKSRRRAQARHVCRGDDRPGTDRAGVLRASRRRRPRT